MLNRRAVLLNGNMGMPDFAEEMYSEAKQKGTLPKKKVEYEAFMVTPQERKMIEAMRQRKIDPEMTEEQSESDYDLG